MDGSVYYSRPGITLHLGDCRQVLRSMPDCSVQCIVTSPPYFGLRNYQCDGQIGLEETPEQYVAEMVAVFCEVRRVLRDDGVCWLNLGDSYNAAGRKGHGTRDNVKQGTNRASKTGEDKCRPSVEWLKPKDLIGIPWMVAFALRDDGWYLRQEIIWHKNNPMPESVADRCTKSHEQIFLLTKAERYFFDSTSIQEDSTSVMEHARRKKIVQSNGNSEESTRNMNGGHNVLGNSEFRNKRSVWSVSTQPYKGAHFATFPPDLIRPCIKAGTSEVGCCPKCLTPWVRVLEKSRVATRPGNDTKVTGDSLVDGNRDPQRHCTVTKTIGWKANCKCGLDESENVACTVLDPFNGAGTTGIVCQEQFCNYIGIDLNEKYLKMAKNRLNKNGSSALFGPQARKPVTKAAQ